MNILMNVKKIKKMELSALESFLIKIFSFEGKNDSSLPFVEFKSRYAAMTLANPSPIVIRYGLEVGFLQDVFSIQDMQDFSICDWETVAEYYTAESMWEYLKANDPVKEVKTENGIISRSALMLALERLISKRPTLEAHRSTVKRVKEAFKCALKFDNPSFSNYEFLNNNLGLEILAGTTYQEIKELAISVSDATADVIELRGFLDKILRSGQVVSLSKDMLMIQSYGNETVAVREFGHNWPSRTDHSFTYIGRKVKGNQLIYLHSEDIHDAKLSELRAPSNELKETLINLQTIRKQMAEVVSLSAGGEKLPDGKKNNTLANLTGYNLIKKYKLPWMYPVGLHYMQACLIMSQFDISTRCRRNDVTDPSNSAYKEIFTSGPLYDVIKSIMYPNEEKTAKWKKLGMPDLVSKFSKVFKNFGLEYSMIKDARASDDMQKLSVSGLHFGKGEDFIPNVVHKLFMNEDVYTSSIPYLPRSTTYKPNTYITMDESDMTERSVDMSEEVTITVMGSKWTFSVTNDSLSVMTDEFMKWLWDDVIDINEPKTRAISKLEIALYSNLGRSVRLFTPPYGNKSPIDKLNTLKYNIAKGLYLLRLKTGIKITTFTSIITDEELLIGHPELFAGTQ